MPRYSSNWNSSFEKKTPDKELKDTVGKLEPPKTASQIMDVIATAAKMLLLGKLQHQQVAALASLLKIQIAAADMLRSEDTHLQDDTEAMSSEDLKKLLEDL
jgi:hypothetical protein